MNNRVKEIKTKGFSFIPEKDNASIDPNNANFTKLKVGIKTLEEVRERMNMVI